MRRSFITALAAVATAALGAGAATASNGCPPKTPPPDRGSHAPCVQYNKITHKCKEFKPTPAPPVTPGPTPTPGPPLPPPKVTLPPPSPPSVPVEFFCVQTKERGETSVQAYEGAFNAGGAWRNLLVQGARVTLGGQTVTLKYEDGLNGREKGVGDGVIVAPIVPGYGPSCDQNAVTAGGVVLHPEQLAGLAPIVV